MRAAALDLYFVSFRVLACVQIRWGFYVDGDKRMFTDLANLEMGWHWHTCTEQEAADKRRDEAVKRSSALAAGFLVALALQVCACPTAFQPADWLWFQLSPHGFEFIEAVCHGLRLLSWPTVEGALGSLQRFLEGKGVNNLFFVLSEAQMLCYSQVFGLLPGVLTPRVLTASVNVFKSPFSCDLGCMCCSAIRGGWPGESAVCAEPGVARPDGCVASCGGLWQIC